MKWVHQSQLNGRIPRARAGSMALVESVAGAAQVVANATKAAARVASAVVRREPVKVPDEILAVRQSICEACEYWQPDGNLGLGKCSHKRCGCTKFKLQLATERCPDGLWERWQKPVT